MSDDFNKVLEQIKQTLSLSDDAIIIVDHTLCIRYINSKASGLITILSSPQIVDFQNAHLHKILPKKDWQVISENISELISSNEKNPEARLIPSLVDDTISYAINLSGEIISIFLKPSKQINPSGISHELVTFFDNLSHGVVLTDGMSRQFLYANDAFSDITGYSAKELRNMSLADINPKEELYEMLSYFRKIDTSLHSYTENIGIERKDGKIRHASVSAQRLNNTQGGLVCAIFIDVTEQNKSTIALQKSEERFRVAHEHSPDGFTILHPIRNEQNNIVDFTWVYQNKAISQINGTENQDIIGKRVLDLFPSHKGTDIFNTYIEVASKGESKILEDINASEVITKPVWLRLVVTCIDEDIAILTQNVTDQKIAENAKIARSKRIKEQHNLIVKLTFEDGIVNKPIDEALEIITTQLANILNVERTSIWLLSEDKKLLVRQMFIDSASGLDSQVHVVETAQLPTYFETLNKYSQIDSDDAQNDPRTKELKDKYLVPLQITSMLDSAIQQDGQVIGVLSAEHRGHIRKWHTDEKSFLSSITNLVSQLLANFERKKAERELKRIARIMSNSQKIANFGSWKLDFTTDKLEWSDETYRILGFDPSGPQPSYNEMVEKSIHPDDAKLLDETFKAAVQEQGVYELEHRIVRPDGSIRWAIEKGHPYFDNNGNLLGYDGATLDITEHKLAEEKLRISEIRYRSVSAVSNTGVWEYHRKEKYLWCSPEYFQMLGGNHNDYPTGVKSSLEESWINLMHPDDRQRATDHFANYLNDGSVGLYENHYRMKHADGSWVWIWSRGKTIRNADGSLSDLTIGTHIDISKLKQHEAEREKLLHDLNERVKELNTQYELYKLIDNHQNGDIGQFLNKAVELIPLGLQYPERVHARLVFNNKEYTTTTPYNPSKFIIKETLRTKTEHKTAHNFIEVSCDFPNADNGTNPFLNEEYNLIFNFARIVGDYIDKLTFQKELKSNEEKFRNIFKHHATVKLLIDPENGRIIDANDAASSFYGWEHEELLSMKFSDINTADSSTVQEKMELEMEEDKHSQKFTLETEHLKKDGTTAIVEVYSSPIDVNGKQILYSVILDITEKKKALEQITLLSRSVEESPASIVITDRNGNITYVNKGFVKVTGFTKDEVKNKNPRILKSGYQDQEFYKNLWETITAGKDWEGEFANKNKNGEIYWEKAVISPIQNANGKITHFVAVKEDITEKKIYLEKLEEQNKRLRDIAWTQSHVVRAPVARILGLSALLKIDDDLPNLSHNDIINGIVDSIMELDKIIFDITEKTYGIDDNMSESR